MLSSHLRLGLPSGLFPSVFPTKTLCKPLPSSIRATCPAHLIVLDFITRTILGGEYRVELRVSVSNTKNTRCKYAVGLDILSIAIFALLTPLSATYGGSGWLIGLRFLEGLG